MPSKQPKDLRCGDVVHHRPTGEEWVVAYVNEEIDDIAWAGWPDGRARLSDCNLVRRCSDEEHRHWVEKWCCKQDHADGDSRRPQVRRRYGHILEGKNDG